MYTYMFRDPPILKLSWVNRTVTFDTLIATQEIIFVAPQGPTAYRQVLLPICIMAYILQKL